MYRIQYKPESATQWRSIRSEYNTKFGGWLPKHQFGCLEDAIKCVNLMGADSWWRPHYENGKLRIIKERSDGREADARDVVWEYASGAVYDRSYIVQVCRGGERWRTAVGASEWGGHDITKPTPILDKAISCAKACAADRGWDPYGLRVIDESSHEVMWERNKGVVTHCTESPAPAVPFRYWEIQIFDGKMWRKPDCNKTKTDVPAGYASAPWLISTKLDMRESVLKFADNNPSCTVRLIKVVAENDQDGEVIWTTMTDKATCTEGGNTATTCIIQKYDKTKAQWRAFNTDARYCGHSLNDTFYDADEACNVVDAREREYTLDIEVIRVIDSTGYVYYSTDGSDDYTDQDFTSTHATAGGDTMTPDLNKPLTIKTTDVLAAIKKNLDAEVKTREDADKANAEARKKTLDAIALFTPDELYNLFRNYYSVDPEQITKAHESSSFVTKNVEPTVRESDLEKFHRVLSMATDTEIELTPDQQLYKLL